MSKSGTNLFCFVVKKGENSSQLSTVHHRSDPSHSVQLLDNKECEGDGTKRH